MRITVVKHVKPRVRVRQRWRAWLRAFAEQPPLIRENSHRFEHHFRVIASILTYIAASVSTNPTSVPCVLPLPIIASVTSRTAACGGGRWGTAGAPRYAG